MIPIPCIWQRYSLKKSLNRKRRNLRTLLSYFHDLAIAMLLLTKSEPRKWQKNFSWILSQKNGKNTIHFSCSQITIHGLLFTDTVHFLLFMTLFTLKFCLFKGGCPLSLDKFLLQNFLPLELLLLGSLLRERIHHTSTTTNTLFTTNLVKFSSLRTPSLKKPS